MERSTTGLYLDFENRRKKRYAGAADEADDAEMKAVEEKLKRRPKP